MNNLIPVSYRCLGFRDDEDKLKAELFEHGALRPWVEIGKPTFDTSGTPDRFHASIVRLHVGPVARVVTFFTKAFKSDFPKYNF